MEAGPYTRLIQDAYDAWRIRRSYWESVRRLGQLEGVAITLETGGEDHARITQAIDSLYGYIPSHDHYSFTTGESLGMEPAGGVPTGRLPPPLDVTGMTRTIVVNEPLGEIRVQAIDFYETGIILRWCSPWHPSESPSHDRPPKLDVRVWDDAGTEFLAAGVRIHGDLTAWLGESRFVPSVAGDVVYVESGKEIITI